MSLSDLSQSASDDTWNSSLPDVSFPRPTVRLPAGADAAPAHKHEAPDFDVEMAEEFEEYPADKKRKIKRYIKIAMLFIVWVTFTLLLMKTHEHEVSKTLLTVPAEEPADYELERMPSALLLVLKLLGPFELEDTDQHMHFKQGDETSQTDIILIVVVQRVTLDDNKQEVGAEDVSDQWKVSLDKPSKFDTERLRERRYEFTLKSKQTKTENSALRLRFSTTLPDQMLAVQLEVDYSPISGNLGMIIGFLLFTFFILLIAFEISHRSFAAIIVCTLGIALLAGLNERPNMHVIISWIDAECLLLVFGMMILIAILMETGIFDYLAVLSYQVFNGHIWPPINTLILITILLALFMDKMSVMILIAPVCIRLCEVMNVHPIPVMITMIVFTNIGAMLTPISDYPNVSLIDTPYFSEHGVNFGNFMLHMLPGFLLVVLQTYIQIRLNFRNIRKIQFLYSPEVTRLRRIISTWNRAAMGITTTSKDEQTVRAAIVSKVDRMRVKLHNMAKIDKPPANFKDTLAGLKEKYPIRNKVLLIKALFSLFFVTGLFLLDSVPGLQSLSLGWIAMMGGMLILILADIEDMDMILSRVSWSTMLLIGILFVIHRVLERFGLFKTLGVHLVHIVGNIDADYRLTGAILIILWVSGMAAAFLDSVPVTTMMMHVTIMMASNKDLNLPFLPLVFATVFGTGLGGNGTIIGAPGNIIGAGIAEQHGYRFYFWYYFKVGFPLTVGNLVIASVYLILAHVVWEWH